MNKSAAVFEQIKENKIIAILAPSSAAQCVEAYEILHPLGITLEIVFRSKAASSGIKAVLDKYPDALILAGTVMTGKIAEHAIKEGVAGIISADYIPEVLEICVSKDIMCVPGGLSDVGKQLVKKAELYGCEFEKLKEKYPYQWVYKFSQLLQPLIPFTGWQKPGRDLTKA